MEIQKNATKQWNNLFEFTEFLQPYLDMYGKKDFTKSTIEVYFKKLKVFSKDILEEAFDRWSEAQQTKHYKQFPNNVDLFFRCLRIEKSKKSDRDISNKEKYCGYCGKIIELKDTLECSVCYNDYSYYRKQEFPTKMNSYKTLLRMKHEETMEIIEKGKKNGDWKTSKEAFFKICSEKFGKIKNGSYFKV